MVRFCEARPAFTMAVYKYIDGQMTLISPEYHLGVEDSTFVAWNADAVSSCVSGDFDNDQIADLAALLKDRILFYYSSDRSAGELPSYNKNNGESWSEEVHVPCSTVAVAIRWVDLDNSGVKVMVLFCKKPGEVFVYKRESSSSWSLSNFWQLGDLTDPSLAGVTSEDLLEVCPQDDYPGSFNAYCEAFLSRGIVKDSQFRFASFVDLDNDGYLDVVTAHKVGYQRFFMNTLSPKNKFIRIELICTESNEHAIGATLLFEASGLNMQFHEVSSYGDGFDGYGTIDDRLVFGLGVDAVPLSLTVRWPTKREETFDLSRISPSHISNYSNPITIVEMRGGR